MKKNVLIIFAFLLSAFNAFADGITVDDITLNNEVVQKLDIKLSNTSTDIVGVQFNLMLPDGVSPVMDDNKVVITPSARLNGTYVLRGSKVSDGSYLFTFLSGDRTAIEGTEGTLLSISLQNSAATDGKYSATVSGVTITDKGGKEQSLSDAAFSITIEHKYNLTYYVDGAAYKSVAYTVGETVTPESNPTKDGYTFSGWSEIPSTMPTNDVTITGTFAINQYKVTFVSDGVVVQEGSQDYSTEITQPENPTKEGYTFTGWYPEVDAVVPSHDVTYMALFTVNQYKVTFISDGNIVQETTQDYGSEIAKPTDPAKEGYTFTGWDPAVDATVPAHDVNYTAVFTVNQYTITFDTDGGSEVTAITQDFGSEITAPKEPTKTGYTFAGWDKEIPATMPAENITIKATWSINSYVIVYMVDGTEYKTVKCVYGETITPSACPEKEGYVFSGWSGIPPTMPAHDIIVTGSFSKGSYKLTYYVDEIKYKEVAYDFGDVITPEACPEKEGYTFSGWSEIPATMPAGDVTITGTFTVKQYKVTFISDGNIVKETTQDYGSTITTPENPTKEGYTFTGWSPEVAETVPANDVTYEAQFSINSYNITYMVDGAEYNTQTVEYGSEITAPDVEPTKEGYTFSGWSEMPATMPANDVTVTASFTVNQYMVRFETEDGTLISEQMQDYGSAIVAPTAPVKEGYEFAGWNEDIAETVPAHDVTYVACYKQIIVYVTEIRLDHSSLSLPEGESTQLNALVLPTNATNQELEWTSSEESVAAVENGLVTAIKEGAAIITAKATDGSNQMGQCIVIVTEGSGVTSIQNANEIEGYYTLDGKRLQKLQKGVNVIRMKNGTTKKVLMK